MMNRTIFSLCLLPTFLWAVPKDTPVVAIDHDSIASIDWSDDPYAASLDALMECTLFPPEDEKSKEVTEAILADIPAVSDSIMALRMAGLNEETPFDLRFRPEVRAFIDLYTNRRREQVCRMMGLAEYYFPMFEEILDKYDLPLELKYLAIVESALNPEARSRAGARGIWQFMYSTGRMEGLHVSSYVDERSDPMKSTEAACSYLSKLYKIFNDWDLALAAYNSGPGNVSKAIRRSGGKRDYWSIRPWLPRETASYVPAFIAVNYVMNYAEDHNLYPIPSLLSYYKTDTVGIREAIHFDHIVKVTGVDKVTLQNLNPSYKHEIIPVIRGRKHFLTLPREAMGLFVSNEDSIYAMAKADFEEDAVKKPAYQDMDERIVHRVRSGESLGVIGRKYGVTVRQIQNWNGLRGTVIRIGQRLTIHPRRLPGES